MATLKEALYTTRSALRAEIRDSLRLEAALRFYAEGGDDGGRRARDVLGALDERLLPEGGE